MVKKKLKVFLEDLNKFHPNLKFKSDSSEENVAFLDLKVKLKQGKIETDLHTKRSIVFSQSLRISRMCSQTQDFKKHTTELDLGFIKGVTLRV